MKMNIPVIFQFLKDLSANNNREWFNEHRSEYEVAVPSLITFWQQ